MKIACALLVMFSTLSCRTPASYEQHLEPRERARVMFERGDAAGAIELLETLHRQSPNDPSIARALAEGHVKAGTGSALLSRLSADDSAIGSYMRGLVLFAQSSTASEPAIAAFERAVTLAPTEPEFLFRLGVAHLESEHFEVARAKLQAAVAMKPQATSWLLPLAKAQLALGQTAPGIESVRALLERTTSVNEAAQARTIVDRQMDPFAPMPAAVKTRFDQALNLLNVADQPQLAADLLEELAREYPDLAITYTLLGLAHAKLENTARAIEALRHAMELAPLDGSNPLYLAELYMGKQRGTQAREQLERAVTLNPTLPLAWYRLGDYAAEQQKWDEAAKAFRISSLLEPKSAATHGRLAFVKQQQGDWLAADAELRKVLDAEPENLEFMLRMGVLHAERYVAARLAPDKRAAAEEAKKWLAKVLEQQPENALASRALERVQKP